MSQDDPFRLWVFACISVLRASVGRPLTTYKTTCRNRKVQTRCGSCTESRAYGHKTAYAIEDASRSSCPDARQTALQPAF